jgi:hypothetical protein
LVSVIVATQFSCLPCPPPTSFQHIETKATIGEAENGAGTWII